MPLRHASALVIAALTGAFCLASSARASGSYPPNPPRLGGAALSKIDARAYNLGKALFTERLALPDTPPTGCDPAANRARLDSVQSLLPERVRGELDLPALSSRLDAAQVDALLYYVSIRFRIETPGAPAPSA